METKTTKTAKTQAVIKETVAKTEGPTKRVFAKDDLIPVRNLFAGASVMIGKRTGNKYVWDDFGDEQYVEYDDLKSAVLNKRSDFIYSPSLLILDDDFIDEFPYLKNFYANMMTPEDLEDLVKNGSEEEFRTKVQSMPTGLKDTVKGLVATMIQEGTLDSVKKIRAIDELLGTELLKQVEMFS